MPQQHDGFVSRGGIKLQHALAAFKLSPAALRCADLGCSTGGFTDCLLQHHAQHVISVDTGYGVLAYKLRSDPRVTTIERANALHTRPPNQPDGSPDLCDLVVLDLSWTPQRLAIPAALAWLKPHGQIITLIKPHYELADIEPHNPALRRQHHHVHPAPQPAPNSAPNSPPPLRAGVLTDQLAADVKQRVLNLLPALGVRVVACTQSPIRGGAKGDGNTEFLALLAPAYST